MAAHEPLRVLVVCTGNSARSQIAEGFLRAYGQGQVEAASAGMEPTSLSPHAVAVMAERGVDISHQVSKPFSEPLARSMDWLITVCADAEARCPILPPSVRRVHWPLPDPARAEGSEDQVRQVFRESRDEIERRLLEFLEILNARGYSGSGRSSVA